MIVQAGAYQVGSLFDCKYYTRARCVSGLQILVNYIKKGPEYLLYNNWNTFCKNIGLCYKTVIKSASESHFVGNYRPANFFNYGSHYVRKTFYSTGLRCNNLGLVFAFWFTIVILTHRYRLVEIDCSWSYKKTPSILLNSNFSITKYDNTVLRIHWLKLSKYFLN
jgi:hypothetical protein